MRLVEYIDGVRNVLRDQTFEESQIIDAINRVIMDVNSMGRFRFHEGSYTLNLTANNYTYAVPGNVVEERILIYDFGTNNQFEIPRRRELWSGKPLVPHNTGNNAVEWYRYENNWYISPIPDATMAANNATMLYDKDLSEMLSLTDVCGLPDRHKNVVIYGAAYQLKPALLVGSDSGEQTVGNAYALAVRNMKQQEAWRFSYIPTVKPSRRWYNASQWGNVDKVR